MTIDYTSINAETVDRWIEDGWEWGKPVSHEVFQMALDGQWEVVLTPTKPVPKDWFCQMKGAKILGLASGGGQQMPVFAALGANCTVLDYSEKQLESERLVALREGYEIDLVRADMTKPLPFSDNAFDLIFHPVSNCYVEDVVPIWRECFRVLKKGGILLAGLENGINYIFGEDEETLRDSLPFNPLKNDEHRNICEEGDWGYQFSHTIEEQIGGQLEVGFTLTGIFHDINGYGKLHDHNVPTYYATRAVK